MAKYYGALGFAISEETKPGVWKNKIVEANYYGDIVRDTRRHQARDKVIDDVTISNQISIVCDAFALENFQTIRYATFMNTKWKIESVEVQYPRLVLYLGGVYNGEG